MGVCTGSHTVFHPEDFQTLDCDKYKLWLCDKSLMFRHVWMTLMILRIVQLLDSKQNEQAFLVLKLWIGDSMNNEKLFNMIFLLCLDYE